MQIQTTRFGTIKINETDLVTFKEGLLGFSNLRQFVLLDDPNDEIFAWLQSCERPEVAFPILEPELYLSDYKVRLGKSDLEAMEMKGDEATRVFNIVTIPDDPTQSTANLKAPIIINVASRLAKQTILQENDYAIKYPVIPELQKRLVQNPTASLKSHAADWGVAVRLPGSAPAPEVNA